MKHSTDKAPYTDPDGHPSWQPDHAVRVRDAWARRLRTARRDQLDARTRVAALIDLLDHAREELAAVDARLAAVEGERETLPRIEMRP